jgi:transcriptional regulator with XRE-family HTH domain
MSSFKMGLCHHDMTERSKKHKQFSDSPLEALRIERTTLTQDELAVHCGIPRSTYQRWIAGKTEAKLSIPQLKKLCQLLGIERIDELPDDFSPPNQLSDEG